MVSPGLQNVPGTRDFYPDLQRLRHWLFTRMHEVLASFGYEEYGGPLLEFLDLYASKSSEEIVREQLFSLTDRGDRKLAIRPEMTPTLARMVAARARELTRPLRWYSIPTCMRNERQQRGRLKEFDQLNVDILGGLPLDEDVEIILTAHALMKAIGARPEDFEVRVNHRGLVNAFLYDVLSVDRAHQAGMLRLLDKRDKITGAEFEAGCVELGLAGSQIQRLEAFLHADLKTLPSLMGTHEAPVRDLEQRFDALASAGCAENLRFDASIMRGFDYYTGLVFEIFDTHESNRRALFGGGRYENLVGSFGVDPLPGIGYGVSDVSLLNFLEAHGLTPALAKKVDVAVVRFGEQDRGSALALAQRLREASLKVETTVSATKFGKQIQAAERSGARAVVFRGADEIAAGTFAVKWLATGVQEAVRLDDVPTWARTHWPKHEGT